MENNFGKVCPSCKTPLEEGDAFCPMCGTAIKAPLDDTLSKAYEDTESKKSKKSKPANKKCSKKLIAVLCTLAVVLLTVIILLPTLILPQINLSMAKRAMEESDYASAVEHYEKSGWQDKEGNADQYTFCLGMEAYGNQDYTTAIVKLSDVKDSMDSAKEILPQVYYDYGKSLFSQKQYSSAERQFEKAGEYSDAKKYISACKVLQAEELFNDGYFNQAKAAFQKLQKGLVVNGISVSGRLKTLNNWSAFLAVSGKWRATKNYISTRDMCRWDGSWDGWKQDETLTNQLLDIRCVPNSDGTVTIKGEVSFYYYTNYSSWSSFLNFYMTTKTFTISHVKSIPSSYRIDANTKLIYSGGKFSISYSKREEYSQYFYYLFDSSVTYGTRINVY